MNRRILIPCLAATTLVLGACGSSSSSSTATPAASTPAAATTPAAPAGADASSGAVTVKASEYAFAPTTINAKAGKLKVTLDNGGAIPHEFILLKTDAAPGALPVKAGKVDESTSVGEVPELKGGAKGTQTFNLKPGKYVFVCNIPTHYALGMRGQLTVT